MAIPGTFEAALSLLELLDRPGNAFRTLLVHGPGQIGPAMRGEVHTRGQDLPLIRDLSDTGGPTFETKFGPVHLSPRALAGVGAEAVLDPLNLIPFEKLASLGLRGVREGIHLLGPFARRLVSDSPQLALSMAGGPAPRSALNWSPPMGDTLALRLEDLARSRPTVSPPSLEEELDRLKGVWKNESPKELVEQNAETRARREARRADPEYQRRMAAPELDELLPIGDTPELESAVPLFDSGGGSVGELLRKAEVKAEADAPSRSLPRPYVRGPREDEAVRRAEAWGKSPQNLALLQKILDDPEGEGSKYILASVTGPSGKISFVAIPRESVGDLSALVANAPRNVEYADSRFGVFLPVPTVRREAAQAAPSPAKVDDFQARLQAAKRRVGDLKGQIEAIFSADATEFSPSSPALQRAASRHGIDPAELDTALFAAQQPGDLNDMVGHVRALSKQLAEAEGYLARLKLEQIGRALAASNPDLYRGPEAWRYALSDFRENFARNPIDPRTGRRLNTDQKLDKGLLDRYVVEFFDKYPEVLAARKDVDEDEIIRQFAKQYEERTGKRATNAEVERRIRLNLRTQRKFQTDASAPRIPRNETTPNRLSEGGRKLKKVLYDYDPSDEIADPEAALQDFGMSVVDRESPKVGDPFEHFGRQRDNPRAVDYLDRPDELIPDHLRPIVESMRGELARLDEQIKKAKPGPVRDVLTRERARLQSELGQTLYEQSFSPADLADRFMDDEYGPLSQVQRAVDTVLANMSKRNLLSPADINRLREVLLRSGDEIFADFGGNMSDFMDYLYKQVRAGLSNR